MLIQSYLSPKWLNLAINPNRWRWHLFCSVGENFTPEFWTVWLLSYIFCTVLSIFQRTMASWFVFVTSWTSLDMSMGFIRWSTEMGWVRGHALLTRLKRIPRRTTESTDTCTWPTQKCQITDQADSGMYPCIDPCNRQWHNSKTPSTVCESNYSVAPVPPSEYNYWVAIFQKKKKTNLGRNETSAVSTPTGKEKPVRLFLQLMILATRFHGWGDFEVLHNVWIS